MCPHFRLEQIFFEDLHLAGRADAQLNIAAFRFDKIKTESFPLRIPSGKDPVSLRIGLLPVRFEPEGDGSVVAVHDRHICECDRGHLIVCMTFHIECAPDDSRLVSCPAVDDSGCNFASFRSDHVSGSVHRHIEHGIRRHQGKRKQKRENVKSFFHRTILFRNYFELRTASPAISPGESA